MTHRPLRLRGVAHRWTAHTADNALLLVPCMVEEPCGPFCSCKRNLMKGRQFGWFMVLQRPIRAMRRLEEALRKNS